MLNTLLKTEKSEELYKKACELIPGGVNSPVRSFKAVGASPLFIAKGNGKYIYDVDGNQYIDLVNSWGPLIHGHNYLPVVEAIQEALKNGVSFGASHENEIKLAQIVVDRVPSIEKLRLVNSGTEAVMTALRLARAYTKRNKIIKFSGCYHGHSDAVLAMSGSGIATLGVPSCEGVSKSVAQSTISLSYNDITSLEITLSKYPDEIAAIIIEPVVGNSGVLIPEVDYLRKIRELCNRYKCVLIFDEVMTGFRLGMGGAQERFGIKPDLTTLGKIIGGGLPIGAVGGAHHIMDLLAPSGPVYQGGTLSGNPLAVACGLKTLEELTSNSYKILENLTNKITAGIKQVNLELGKPYKINSICSMFSVFFTDSDVNNFEDAKRSNVEQYADFFKFCLRQGIYFPPSQFESSFLSLAHTEEDVNRIVETYKQFLLCR